MELRQQRLPLLQLNRGQSAASTTTMRGNPAGGWCSRATLHRWHVSRDSYQLLALVRTHDLFRVRDAARLHRAQFEILDREASARYWVMFSRKALDGLR